MSKTKTISGHYDTAYNIDHNNRIFIPKNVDERRIAWNYNCVAAGQEAYFNPAEARHISEFWSHYRELNQLYWSNRTIAQTLAYERYQEHLQYIRRFSQSIYPIPHNPVEALITLLFLPLLIPCGIYLHKQHKEAKAEWEQFKDEQWIRNMTFKSARSSLRDTLYMHDLKDGTKYLHIMDTTMKELGAIAQNQITSAVPLKPTDTFLFATLEEIYNKVYEPSFQAFQNKQRPCRRFNGTYLEQIRAGQHKTAKAKQQSKNTKSRKTAEAIEIVFTIGDKDNTGYAEAFVEAKCAEEILGDFCDHLLGQSNLCTVTTKELEDPNWEPLFKNGLIVVNLTVHADEATPGVHLTCIPYSCDCKRGPAVQASMGRALAGMGYPSTWKDSLDESGSRIPKRNKNGDIVYNLDGSIRYKQEPDKQGILDWIEEQKQWIQKEMKRRYDWDREYKGSHARGNLSTPDYQASRAKERYETYQQLLNESLSKYDEAIYDLTVKLDDVIEGQWRESSNQDVIERYLSVCTDEEYEVILKKASTYLDQLAHTEQSNHRNKLIAKIQEAENNLLNNKTPHKLHDENRR